MYITKYRYISCTLLCTRIVHDDLLTVVVHSQTQISEQNGHARNLLGNAWRLVTVRGEMMKGIVI